MNIYPFVFGAVRLIQFGTVIGAAVFAAKATNSKLEPASHINYALYVAGALLYYCCHMFLMAIFLERCSSSPLLEFVLIIFCIAAGVINVRNVTCSASDSEYCSKLIMGYLFIALTGLFLVSIVLVTVREKSYRKITDRFRFQARRKLQRGTAVELVERHETNPPAYFENVLPTYSEALGDVEPVSSYERLAPVSSYERLGSRRHISFLWWDISFSRGSVYDRDDCSV